MYVFQRQKNGISIGIGILFLAGLFLFGCGDVAEQGGSLFYVNTINGTYQEGMLTNQVDVVFTTDCDGDPTTDDPEFYSDNFTEVNLINRPLPNSKEQTASTVYIRSYEITYTPLTTPTTPYPLPSPIVVQVTDTQGIPPCEPDETCTGVTMTQLYFVPLATKTTLNGFYMDADPLHVPGEQLAYNCRYRFFGENDFGDPVTAEAQYNFYVDNYNFCDSGG